MGQIIVKSSGLASIYLPTLHFEAMPYSFRGNGIRLKVPYDNYVEYLQSSVIPNKHELFYDSDLYSTLLEDDTSDDLKYTFLLDTCLACLKEIYFCKKFSLNNYNRIEPVGLGVPKIVNRSTVDNTALNFLTVVIERFNEINDPAVCLSVRDYKNHPALSYMCEIAATALDSLQLYDFICM